MNSMISFNTQRNKRAMKANSRTIVIFASILLLVVLGLTIAWPRYNEFSQKRLATKAIQALIEIGNYQAIKPYVASDFLGNISEEEFNNTSILLTDIKEARIEINGITENSVYGTLVRDATNDKEGFAYVFYADTKRQGLGHKITKIATDYGRSSALSPDQEYLKADDAAGKLAEQETSITKTN